MVGRPIVFAGIGERLEELEQFHPDRMAGRILGMGDVASLVEKAQEVVDEKKAARLEAKLRKNKFDLEDLRDQLKSLKKMGPLQSVMDMMPGMNNMMPKGGVTEGQERQLKRFESCIDSMTPRRGGTRNFSMDPANVGLPRDRAPASKRSIASCVNTARCVS